MENAGGSGILYSDLASMQEARELVKRALAAQKAYAEYNQEKVDRIIAAMADAGYENARRLAAMAVEESGIGRVEDKVVKNQFASRNVYEAIKDMRTAGIINEDRAAGIIEIADPMGVVVGLIPTTNPTSTIIFKAMIALKSRNAIVFSPHPRSIKCSIETARVMEEAAVSAGAPRNLVNCLTMCTREATDELMRHPDVAVILATGGSAMVKAAYSSGKPAYGVGPGNVPAFVERSADIPMAVHNILTSKTFDNGTVCASEQAVVTEEVIAGQVEAEFKRQGAYFVNDSERPLLEKTVMQPNGGVNPKVVGQSPEVIAKMAGIKIPEGTRVIVARLSEVGRGSPLSAEKLCPVLGFYVEKDWHRACERCIELLNIGGLGHSLVIHSNNDEVIREFGLRKPVNRILVNTPSSQGAIGYTTGLQPSLTLGCGTKGNNITSDNVGPQHLMNVKRLAYGRGIGRPAGVSGNMGFAYKRDEIAKAVREYLKA